MKVFWIRESNLTKHSEIQNLGAFLKIKQILHYIIQLFGSFFAD